MPETLMGWLLVVSVIAMTSLLIVPLRSNRPQRLEAEKETVKIGLEDIAARLKQGKLDEAAADAARLELLSRLRPSDWRSSMRLTASPRILATAAIAFALVTGVGAALTYGQQSVAPIEANAPASALAADDEDLSDLKTYASSGGSGHASATAPDKLLPDVTTMIDRLAARLESAPNDIEGWRLLGWSYFHTERYQQAAAAFTRAVELDPSSAELKQIRDDAQAKATEQANATSAVAPLQTGSVDVAAEGRTAHPATQPGDAAQPTDPAILAMVDGLAARLEASPRDVDGWTRLMRSRVVLGQTDVATNALRKALDTFKDDTAASGTITAAALELGLKPD